MFGGYTSPYYSRTYGKSGAERDRPSTLNLGTGGTSGGGTAGGGSSYNTGGGIVGTLGGGGTAGTAGSGTGGGMPSKPSRYLGTGATTGGSGMGQSSGSSGVSGGGGGGRSSSSAYTNIPPSSYSSYANQRSQQHPGSQQDVITVPPKSTLSMNKPQDLQSQTQVRENPMSSSTLSGHPYYKSPQYPSRPTYQSPYQIPHTIQLQQPQSSIHSHHIIERPSGGVTSSKSTHNLIMDSIPDVFCLSCPPAEFKFSDAYRAKTLPRTGKENERLIGFATLPEQVHRKSVKKGFDFTLMAIGESGLGKSTLINSLFLADFYQNRKIPTVNDLMKRTTTIQKHTIEIEERGVKLRLTVVDTPGFGDAINSEDSWKTCVDYIDDQFQQYFQAESGLNRRHIQDTRVHCCLYFVPPYGHGLRALDIEVLKNLQSRVNVIPVIAKADTLTPTEVKKLKDQILGDLRSNQIQIYQFPECDEEEDEEFKKQDRELKAAIPFAVASSETFVEVAGKRVRGRQYPWGIVEVENPNHSDFSKLRTMLIQSHMHDLKETTQDLHYENFRAKAIAQISNGTGRERSKLKRDSSYDSPQDLLLQKEAEIKRMQQMISNMEAKLKAANQPKTMRDSIIDL